MPRKVVAVVALLLLVLVSIPHTSAVEFTIPFDGPVADGVASIVLELPPVVESILATEVKIYNLTCTNLRAATLTLGIEFGENDTDTAGGTVSRSAAIAAMSAVAKKVEAGDEEGLDLGGLALGLALSDLTLDCVGMFNYSGLPDPPPIGNTASGSGNLTMSFGNGSFVHVGVSVRRDGGGGSVPPEYQAALRNCSMEATVVSFHTTDRDFNSINDTVIRSIERKVPGIVCDDVVAPLVNDSITSLVNGVSVLLFNITSELEEDDPPELFNVMGFTWAFTAATVVFIILLVYFVVTDSRHKRRQLYVPYGEDDLPSERTPFAENAGKVDKEGVERGDTGLYGGSAIAQNATPGQPVTTVSMIMHPRVAWYWKYSILGLLLYNLALFASATVSVGAAVYIYLTVGNVVSKLPSIYTFTLISSCIEMWEAGVWPLSLLIGVTSGIWPYVKLLLMLVCWITPPWLLPLTWRRTLLQVLDALGKWSLIDAYVLVLFLEGFRVPIKFADQLRFDMVAEAHYGYFSYLGATMLSLTLTHVVLFFHNHLENPPVTIRERESVSAHRFEIGRERSSFTIVGVSFVALMLLFTTVAVVLGGIAEAFEYTYDGSLVGVLMDRTGEDTTKAYSVVTLFDAIPQTSFDSPNEIGIRIIQITFLFFAYIIPLGAIVSVAFIWLVPLSYIWQHSIFVVVEVLSAWQALDVFIVAVIVALVELEQFAEFIVADRCDELNILLETFFPDGDANGLCFFVSAKLGEGSYILLGAVAALLIVGYSVMVLCTRAIDERLKSGTLPGDVENGAEVGILPTDSWFTRLLNGAVRYTCGMVWCVTMEPL